MVLRNDAIRELRSKGYSLSYIAEQYGLTKSRVQQIVNGPTSPKRDRPYEPGTVYFVQLDRYIKIGYTQDNVWHRFASNAWPVDITLLGVMEGSRQTEAQVQMQFEFLRHRGDWFHESSELRDWIAENTTCPERPANVPRLGLRLCSEMPL